MNKNIDLENSSYSDLKNIFSKLTWKSWGLLFGALSAIAAFLILIGFIKFPWINQPEIKENKPMGMLVASYVANKIHFKSGYLHQSGSDIKACINDYKKSFNEVGAQFNSKLPDATYSNQGEIKADLNGHDIYAYCYLAKTGKINSYAILFANGKGDTNDEAQKNASLAGVNLDSVISHLKGVQPL